MADRREASDEPSEPNIDERGVDRAQIRRMLALSAQERLRWLEDTVASIVEILQKNERHPVR